MKQLVILKGNPTPEEQALIFARLHTRQADAKAKKSSPSAHDQVDAWTQRARSEQLNRWPAHIGDTHWLA